MWLFDVLHVYREKTRDKRTQVGGMIQIGSASAAPDASQGSATEGRRGVWEWRCLWTPRGLNRTWEHRVDLTKRGCPSLTPQPWERGGDVKEYMLSF